VLERVQLEPQLTSSCATCPAGSGRACRRPRRWSATLVLLDEPTVGLDPLLRRDLWRLFGELAAEGAALLVSSHVLDEACHCDEVILLREERIVA
jgi:ABC-type sugar transport system ATPase subunit